MKWYSLFLSITMGYVIKVERRHVDYSKWLGPDYENKGKKPMRCSTYISNHTGMADAFTYLWALDGDFGFYGGAFIKKIPLVRECVVASEGMFVARGGTEAEK